MSARVRAALLVVITALLLALSGSSASAQFPGTDCKTPPTPEFPGSGVVGQIDPPVAGQGVPGTVYHEVGYGGLIWHTYDLGCGPDAAVDPGAVADTWSGNLLFDAAKFVVSATIAVNNLVVEGGLLDRLDDLMVTGTVALYQGVFMPLVGLALLILGAVLLVLAFRARLAELSRRTLIALVGLGVATAAYLTPLMYLTIADGVLANGMQQIRASILGQANVSSAHGLSQTLHEQVVYEAWLAGEFGSADNASAREHGRDLVRTQAFTRSEVEAGTTGEAAVEDKQRRYEEIAEAVPPPVYQYLTGQAASRTGTGFYALGESLIYSTFQLAAGAVIFVCLLLLRVIVLLAPVLGLVMVLRPQTMSEMLSAVGTAVWQALYLTVVAALHLILMVYIAELGLGAIGALLLMFAITVVLWWVTGPWRRLRAMVSATAAATGAEVSPGMPRRKIDFDLHRAQGWFSGSGSGSSSGPRHSAEYPPGPPPSDWRTVAAERAPDRSATVGTQPVIEGQLVEDREDTIRSRAALSARTRALPQRVSHASRPDNVVSLDARRGADAPPLRVYRPSRDGTEPPRGDERGS